MRTIEIISDATDNRLQLTESACPMPMDNQVLIKVAAAGVNRPDLFQRQGAYPPPAGASPILGLEVAGTIAATGANITQLRVGDRVCALVTGGGYAEYCLAPASCCLPIPQALSFIEAAALPETFFTVWSNVFDRGHLSAGESLLIHGGGSGIGTTAILLAKAFNHPVYVTVGSSDKQRRCIELGANAAINYRTDDFVGLIRQFTDNRGVDVILDMIGGDYFPRNLNCLASEGRLIQIAIQHGSKSEINLWQLMQKRHTISGSTLRARDETFKGRIAAQLQQKVWPLLADGTIKPVIDCVFPLADADTAHSRMANNQHFGKIILEI